MDIALLQRLNGLRRARKAGVVVTRVSDASNRLVAEGDGLDGDPLRVEIASAFRSGKSGVVVHDTEEYFLTAHLPPPRIVAIGAVHITQALIPIAAVADFDLIVVDPRTAFATPERFAGCRLFAEWPEDVLPGLGLDPHTAVAAVTHDPKIDDFALRHALERGCFYVGALGSRKTHAKRRERLIGAGVPEADIEAIRAPIGMDIGASTPAEIAVAVMAEIIEAYRRRPIDVTGTPR
ncbi:XdhC family protein [Chthonobacter albigriseus]|uniref:XdhC family protein n=1 Tax=Chthonobacter albigriseus TaxID=1683161 RepID=UPI0015EF2A82|nr:XdhC family protein [Chthonobacter albigriseus]